MHVDIFTYTSSNIKKLNNKKYFIISIMSHITIFVYGKEFNISISILKEIPDCILNKCIDDKYEKSSLEFNFDPEIFNKYFISYINNTEVKFNKIETINDLTDELELLNNISSIFDFFILQKIEYPINAIYNPSFIKKIVDHNIFCLKTYALIQEYYSKIDFTFPHYYYIKNIHEKRIQYSDECSSIEKFSIVPDFDKKCFYLPIKKSLAVDILVLLLNNKFDVELYDHRTIDTKRFEYDDYIFDYLNYYENTPHNYKLTELLKNLKNFCIDARLLNHVIIINTTNLSYNEYLEINSAYNFVPEETFNEIKQLKKNYILFLTKNVTLLNMVIKIHTSTI